MPAPDLPPPIVHPVVPRPLAAHLTPALAHPHHLAGAVVVVIDLLRASTTITAALHAGVTNIIPTLTVEDALTLAHAAKPRPLLGGERAGQPIPGFHLGNSPSHYTPALLSGRQLIFTTTNGTAALLHAASAGAAEVYTGALSNLTALSEHLAADPRPVHLLCAGTRDEVTLDDVIAAGAYVEALAAAGRTFEPTSPGDQARLCLAAWHLASEDLPAALAATKGGRNLTAIGLAQDLHDCAKLNTHPVIPRYNPTTNQITSCV